MYIIFMTLSIDSALIATVLPVRGYNAAFLFHNMP